MAVDTSVSFTRWQQGEHTVAWVGVVCQYPLGSVQRLHPYHCSVAEYHDILNSFSHMLKTFPFFFFGKLQGENIKRFARLFSVFTSGRVETRFGNDDTDTLIYQCPFEWMLNLFGVFWKTQTDTGNTIIQNRRKQLLTTCCWQIWSNKIMWMWSCFPV